MREIAPRSWRGFTVVFAAPRNPSWPSRPSFNGKRFGPGMRAHDPGPETTWHGPEHHLPRSISMRRWPDGGGDLQGLGRRARQRLLGPGAERSSWDTEARALYCTTPVPALRFAPSVPPDPGCSWKDRAGAGAGL